METPSEAIQGSGMSDKPPYATLDDYYVRFLAPRLDELLHEGYITPAMYKDFRLLVENAKGRMAAKQPALAKVAP